MYISKCKDMKIEFEKTKQNAKVVVPNTVVCPN